MRSEGVNEYTRLEAIMDEHLKTPEAASDTAAKDMVGQALQVGDRVALSFPDTGSTLHIGSVRKLYTVDPANGWYSPGIAVELDGHPGQWVGRSAERVIRYGR